MSILWEPLLSSLLSHLLLLFVLLFYNEFQFRKFNFVERKVDGFFLMCNLDTYL